MGFDSIQDGKVMLRTDTGETVEASDVSFGSESEALVYEAIASLGTTASASNALLRAYQGKTCTDAEIFARGIQEAFQYGQMGIPMAEMADSAFASKLSKFQMEYAYNRGAEKADVQNLRKRYAVKSTVKAAVTVEPAMKREHKVILDDNITELEMTASQKVTYQFAQRIAGTIKCEIHVFGKSHSDNCHQDSRWQSCGYYAFAGSWQK